jgi:hypothetical protein
VDDYGRVTLASVRPIALAFGAALFFFLAATPAFAQPGGASGAGAGELPPDTQINIAPTPPEPRAVAQAAPRYENENENEPPPMRPRQAGLVLATNLGMLGFIGEFRHVAPPAYWLQGQLGFELLRWLMVYGEAELAFTDTSESQDESHAIAVPMWGFGGGARVTVHASQRVAFFGQAEVGALTAIVAHDALSVLGFRSAESLNADFGGRLGVEWYQADRHLALTAAAGTRFAQGFAKVLSTGDTPMMWDGSVGLRYTF